MSEHKMTLTWKRGDVPFEYQKYPSNHTWKFDGGHEMTASAAPAYLGDPRNVDPEETFVRLTLRLSQAHLSRDRAHPRHPLLFMMFANAVAHR